MRDSPIMIEMVLHDILITILFCCSLEVVDEYFDFKGFLCKGYCNDIKCENFLCIYSHPRSCYILIVICGGSWHGPQCIRESLISFKALRANSLTLVNNLCFDLQMMIRQFHQVQNINVGLGVGLEPLFYISILFFGK